MKKFLLVLSLCFSLFSCKPKGEDGIEGGKITAIDSGDSLEGGVKLDLETGNLKNNAKGKKPLSKNNAAKGGVKSKASSGSKKKKSNDTSKKGSSTSEASSESESSSDEIAEANIATFFLDNDGDGFGSDANSIEAYSLPSGYVEDNTDCDDNAKNVNPDASEVCDSEEVDEDCDPNTLAEETVYYPDLDGDGYGDKDDNGVLGCSAPDDYVADNTDCNDENEDMNPGETEVCDSEELDEDCDSSTTAEQTEYYPDLDGDGFGDSEEDGTAGCSAPDDYVTDNTDCNDDDLDINPDATEVCDDSDVDENCDGYADDEDSKTSEDSKGSFYADSDGDGDGDLTAEEELFCNIPDDYSDNNSDSFPEDPELSVCSVTVTDDGDTSLDEAVDAAADGDLVCVTEGEYYGEVSFSESTAERDLQIYCLDQDLKTDDSGNPYYSCILNGEVTNDTPSSRVMSIVSSDNGSSNAFITSDTVVSGFTLQNGSSSTDQGGALYVAYAGATLKNLIIQDSESNSTGFAGGGVAFYSVKDVTLRDSQILRNKATNDATNAKPEGGGLAILSSKYVTLKNIKVHSNKAVSGYGGGISLKSSKFVTFSEISLVGNTSSKAGGGLYLLNASLEGRNFLVTGNKGNYGGAIYFKHGSASVAGNNPINLYNLTISGNRAVTKAGAFHIETKTVLSIRNSIIKGNSSNSSIQEINNKAGTKVTMDYVNIDCNADDIEETADSLCDSTGDDHVLKAENSITSDCFTDADNGDYSIADGSDCVDSGSNVDFSSESLCTSKVDILGNPRCTNTTIDIGAYEYK